MGKLRKIRQKLEFYPGDVWLYMLAAQWTKISQEEAFVGRAGDVGDELGSGLVAARIVREIIKLAFLMEKQYAPYSKWLGTAFAKLKIASKLTNVIQIRNSRVCNTALYKEHADWAKLPLRSGRLDPL